MENPFIDSIFDLLLAQNHPLKIHQLSQLIKPLQQTQLDADPNLHLYKLNFLLMNALYQLQQQLADDYTLQISSLHIELKAKTKGEQGQNIALQGDAKLGEFYLDWQNYQATEEEVDALLTHFWQNLHRSSQPSADTYQQALALFNLPEDASFQQVKKRWRQLALTYHPDRSGHPPELFQRYLAAWQVLKCNRDCIS